MGYNVYVNILKLKKLYFKSLPNLIILVGIIFLGLSFGPLIKDEAWFYLKERVGQKYGLNQSGGAKDSVFARFLNSRPVSLEPFLTGFLPSTESGVQPWERPVDVLVLRDGSVLISGDRPGRILRVAYTGR